MFYFWNEKVIALMKNMHFIISDLVKNKLAEKVEE